MIALHIAAGLHALLEPALLDAMAALEGMDPALPDDDADRMTEAERIDCLGRVVQRLRAARDFCDGVLRQGGATRTSEADASQGW